MASLSKEHGERQPEHSSEAVDALIEAGQEEGILEEGDRDLIQSVVEFGDKTVREVMTPRPEIVAVLADTTVEQFPELVNKYPYSRIPVYDGISTTSWASCMPKICCRCRIPKRAPVPFAT